MLPWWLYVADLLTTGVGRKARVMVVEVLQAVGLVAVFGAAGGVGSYLATTGVRGKVEVKDGPAEAGVFRTALVGAFAAGLGWATQAGYDALPLFGDLPKDKPLDLGDFVLGLTIGFAGSKWLADSAKLKVVAHLGGQAALSPPDSRAAAALAGRDIPRAARVVKQS